MTGLRRSALTSAPVRRQASPSTAAQHQQPRASTRRLPCRGCSYSTIQSDHGSSPRPHRVAGDRSKYCRIGSERGAMIGFMTPPQACRIEARGGRRSMVGQLAANDQRLEQAEARGGGSGDPVYRRWSGQVGDPRRHGLTPSRAFGGVHADRPRNGLRRRPIRVAFRLGAMVTQQRRHM